MRRSIIKRTTKQTGVTKKKTEAKEGEEKNEEKGRKNNVEKAGGGSKIIVKCTDTGVPKRTIRSSLFSYACVEEK